MDLNYPEKKENQILKQANLVRDLMRTVVEVIGYHDYLNYN